MSVRTGLGLDLYLDVKEALHTISEWIFFFSVVRRRTADFLTTKTLRLSFSIMTALHWFGLKSDYFH